MDIRITKDYLREHSIHHRELRIQGHVRKITGAMIHAAEKGAYELIVTIVDKDSLSMQIVSDRVERDIAKDVYERLQSCIGDVDHSMGACVLVFKW